MKITEMKTPIRIYWDLSPLPSGPAPDPVQICSDLIQSRILMLNLLDTRPAIGEECLSILQLLQYENIAVSLTLSPTALDQSVVAQLASLRIRALFMAVKSYREITAAAVLHSDELPLPVGISFEVSQDNYSELPSVLAFCRDNGISQLVLPMPRLVHSKLPYLIGPAERNILTKQLAAIGIPPHMKLVIHDPFLWKVFFPEILFPDGGCQAANTMLYIAPDGAVYPCPTLPVKLGDLRTTPLPEVITSAIKQKVRENITSLPTVCRECEDLNFCFGGCRGRAYADFGSFEGPDPECKPSSKILQEL